MKKEMHLIKRRMIFRRFDSGTSFRRFFTRIFFRSIGALGCQWRSEGSSFSPLIFWKLRKARFAVLMLFCFWMLAAQKAVSKGQEPVVDFKVEPSGSGAAYTNFENSADSVKLQGIKELPLEKSQTGQTFDKNEARIKAFLREMALFFEANGKRGESMSIYMNGLTQFYKIAELYRTMTLSERKMIKDSVTGDKEASPMVNYLDAFVALNQDSFLRVLAEMFAEDNPKLVGKTIKTQDVELMLQVVKLGKQNINVAGEREGSLCTDPHLSSTST
jgi:hypothetical protein